MKGSDIPSALINIDNVLENADHSMLEVGSWLTVIGYIRQMPNSDGDPKQPPPKTSIVDATMIIPATAVKLDTYNSAVQSYQESMPSS